MSQYLVPFFAASLILEGSLLSFPLVFILITISAVKTKKNWVFPAAFLVGLILDSFYFKNLGTISIFFLLFLFAVFTYERKFEIDNSTFIFISSFLGAMVFLTIIGESQVLLKSFLTSIFALILSKTW